MAIVGNLSITISQIAIESAKCVWAILHLFLMGLYFGRLRADESLRHGQIADKWQHSTPTHLASQNSLSVIYLLVLQAPSRTAHGKFVEVYIRNCRTAPRCKHLSWNAFPEHHTSRPSTAAKGERAPQLRPGTIC